MKYKMKRWTALVLTMALCLSLLQTAALATEADNEPMEAAVTETEALETELEVSQAEPNAETEVTEEEDTAADKDSVPAEPETVAESIVEQEVPVEESELVVETSETVEAESSAKVETSVENSGIALTSLEGDSAETGQVQEMVTFAGGDGTEENPYQISTPEQFAEIENNLNACFVLVNDLTLNTNIRISNFSGKFDGQGHTLTVYYSAAYGLFETIEKSGAVKNTNINASNYAYGMAYVQETPSWSAHAFGGIALINNGVIENCSMNGTISYFNTTLSDFDSGAICAINNGDVSLCSSNVTFNYTGASGIQICNGAADVGGIAGESSGTITKCLNTGSIIVWVIDPSTAAYSLYYAHTGGIVGYSTGAISECASTSELNLRYTGTLKPAMLIGYITGQEYAYNGNESLAYGDDCYLSESSVARLDYDGAAYDIIYCTNKYYTIKTGSEIETWWEELILNYKEEDDGDEDTLTFDEESYFCNVDDTITISVAYISETAPDEITWTCSDEDAVTFSGTSVLGPFDIDGKNTYYISVQVTAGTAGEYDITLDVDGVSATVRLTSPEDVWQITQPQSLTFGETSVSCNVDGTVNITAVCVTTKSIELSDVAWTLDNKIVSVAGTEITGPTITGEENTYWISAAITGLTAGTTTLTLSVFERSASVSVTVNQNEYMGIGTLTEVDDNLNYIFIDDVGYVAPDSEFTRMKELLNNKKISDKRVIFKYTDYDVIISAYSIYDVLCFQAENVQVSPKTLEYGTDGTYQTSTIEVTADLFVTVDRSSNALYSPSDVLQLKESELYLKLDDVTLTAKSASNIVYFGKTLWVKSTKKEIETDASSIGYGSNRSVSITVSADIDNNAEPEEASATVQIMKLFAAVAGDEDAITASECSVEVINQYEAEKESALDALAESYKNAEIYVELNQTLQFLFAEGSNGGKDDLATLEYIVKMLELETIASYNSSEEGWAERLGNLAAEKLRDALLSKLGLPSSVFVGTNTEYVYARYTGTNGTAIDLKIPVIEYTMGDSVVSAFNKISYSVDGKQVDSSHKVWNEAGMVTYYNMSNFADAVVSYIKIAYNQAWGKSADKAAEYLIGKPLSDLSTFGKIVNTSAKVLGLTKIKLPTSISGGIFEFAVSQVKASVSVQCPVDVYIYDSNGQICGVIENNEINPYFSDENVVLSVDGDEKYITLTNDNYSILLVGTDNGIMTYQINQYLDAELVQSATTTDIPLEDGIVYAGYIPQVVYSSAEFYELIGEDEEPISVTSFVNFEEDDTDYSDDHIGGDAVIENEVAATCTENGGYDSVVYCTECGEEVSRETIIIPAIGHTCVDGVCTLCGAKETINVPGDNTPGTGENNTDNNGNTIGDNDAVDGNGTLGDNLSSNGTNTANTEGAKQTSSAVKTGDEQHPVLWVVLLVVATAGFVTLLVVRKKNTSK